MRRVRYSVAMSLDGFIAGPKGESDWIVMDPEIDFEALASSFDTSPAGPQDLRGCAADGRRARNAGHAGDCPVTYSPTI